MLTEAQAVEIAREEFSKHGQDAEDYDVTVETFHADKNQWMVRFEKKGPFRLPGGHAAVLVHKVGGSASFKRGR